MTKRRQTSDGRVMTLPELRINEGSLSPDTIFTVSGASPWGSTSKYNVVLNGPNSYYTYKASQLETDENGDEIRSWVTKTGNDPKRLARYRLYVKEGEQANDYTSGWEDFLRAIGLKKKDGGWLDKFQDGGTTLQQAVSPEQDVMNIIDAAIGEIQTKRPGQAVQKLAAMMQDPNYSMIIDTIKQEYPQIESVLNTVEQMVGAFKCGGKTKKKVKKGAKGCVPCKKLMRVGGKLINVLTDCEGNIISKHLAGGWLIPKGYNGLLTDKLVADKYRTVNTGTATEGAEHYYIADDGSLRRQYAVANNNGGFDWAYENLNQNLNHEGFNKWLYGTINSDTGERAGGVSDFWSNGVNYNNGAVTFNDEATAKGILGEEEYNKGAITGNSVHGVSKSGNTWLGDKVEDLNVTGQDYVQHHGSWQNAMQAEDDILKAKRRASRKLARYRRQDIRNLYRDLDNISIDLDGEGGNDAKSFSNKREARQEVRNFIQEYMKEARQARTANLTAILGTLAPERRTISQNSLKMQTPPSGRTALPSNDVIGAKKQGGWLNKFLDGGTTEPKLSEYKFHRREIKTPAGYSVIQEGFYPTYSFGNKTGITYDFDDSPRWGRNIYITPHGNDTVYYHTSDPYEYLDMYPTTYILVGTPYKSQQVAKKGWHNMLHGTNIPVRPLDGDEAAFNRAKKEK